MSTSAAMAKEFKLPMIPGTTCGEEMLRRNYRKTQIFGGKPDRLTKTDAALQDQAAANDTLIRTQLLASINNTASEGSPSKAPSLTGKVLRFYAYTVEAVQESNQQEKERVRKAVICYFIEDGTISVAEPRQDNSGFAFQGTIVKRHVIPTPGGSPITLTHLAVGVAVPIYGRIFNLIDADAFTRQFYDQIGAPLAEAQEIPRDDYTLNRSRPQKVHDVPSIASTTALNITLSAEQIRGTQQFLAFDRNVLRCDCTWDDTKNLYGEVHYLTLYYFLSDDCIAVVEKDGVNTGRDPFPNFVRRMKIPRTGASGKFENISSSLTFKSKDANTQAFYTTEDIRIGNVLNIFGREVKICDYDKNTRDFLQSKYGISSYNPINYTVAPKPKAPREMPPYNGFGDEDDSLGSCLRLDVKPPRKDGSRFAKYGDGGVKFVMRLDNGVPTDEIRRFVITCFLADDTIAIFEPVQRNSGIVGGKFLQRQKVKSASGKLFVASDFHVGCKVTINGFPFLCIATDERSLSFMETNSDNYEHSDVNRILRKVQSMLISRATGLADAFHKADSSDKGTIDFQDMNRIFTRLGLPISDQELLTVLRYFDRSGESSISYEDFISRILPAGSVVGRDDRSWEELFTAASQEETVFFANASAEKKQQERVRTALAAQAASNFLEQYHARRTLFVSEFKFVADYATDSLIGAREFTMCVRERLRLTFPENQLNALNETIFPAEARRITFEELLRLFNGTSNRAYNFAQIAKK